MREYTAEICYEEATVKRLDAAVTNSFRFSRRLCFYLICIALMIGGVVMGMGTTYGMLAILTGCLLIPSANSTLSRNARQIIRALNGRILRMHYSFLPDSFICYAGEGKTEYPYDAIIRLVEEDDYLYLFLSASQACMIDVSTIVPKEIKKFKEDMVQRTGLLWTKPFSLRSFSIEQYQYNKRNTRMK